MLFGELFAPELPLVVVPLPLPVVEPLALPVVVPLPEAPVPLLLVVVPLPVVEPFTEPFTPPLLIGGLVFGTELGLISPGALLVDGTLFIGVPFMSEPLLVVDPFAPPFTLPVVPWPDGATAAPVEEPALPPAPPLEPSETPPVEPPEAPPPDAPAPPAAPPEAPPPEPPAAASRYWSGVAALMLENGTLSRARLASHE